MKINLKKFLFFSLVSIIFSSACQKEGILNDEADVISFSLTPASVIASKANITERNINIQVVKGTDITKLTPVFTLSKGATISPENNKEMDFSKPVEFTVVSENKAVKNTYIVTVAYPIESYLYKFENWKANLVNPYVDEDEDPLKGEQPIEINEKNESVDFWASSNFGFGFLNDKKEKEEYPIREINGKIGKGASLVTREGLADYGAPIIAGSLFSGSFDMQAMIGTPMKATHFGQPIGKEPVKIKGYYAYKSGENVTDIDSKKIEGKDKGVISAVFYEIDDNFTHLDGTNLYDDNHIVSFGKFEFSDTEGEDFHEFSLDLIPVDNTKQIDFKNKKYKLALVFSSSAKGDLFIGAVGSELKIDEIEVLTK